MAKTVICIYMDKKSYGHILQKTGVLGNFTVAKVVNKKDIEELKKLIRSVTTSEEEYSKLFAEEMNKLSDMHSKSNPVPGIIYPRSIDQMKILLFKITKKFCEGVRNKNFSKNEMTFLITAIINELGLTQEDFLNLKQNLENEMSDEDDDSDETNQDA